MRSQYITFCSADTQFQKLEAMSPEELKSQNFEVPIRYGIHPTPFGNCLLATTSRGICQLHFLDSEDESLAIASLRLKWLKVEIIRDQLATQAVCEQIFASPIVNNEPLAVFVKGTPFQIQVWQALLQIPFGSTITYQGLAKAIGCATASRAVGNAIASNPIGYLIPCHRVIRKSGKLGGYRWGLARKTAILLWESSLSYQLSVTTA